MSYDTERGPEFSFEKKPTEAASETDQEAVLNLGKLASYLTDARSPANQSLTFQHQTHTGGRGMSLQETIREVTVLQQQIKDQMALINDFMRDNRESIQMVQTELKGSAKGYDQMMLASLNETEQSLKKSLESLQRASSALDKVRAI